MSELLADPGSDSTGSPMALDEMDDELINSEGFLYFPTSNRVQVATQPEQVEPADAFSEPVVRELPYVVSASQDKHIYDGVLLDEERVIGIFVSFISSQVPCSGNLSDFTLPL